MTKFEMAYWWYEMIGKALQIAGSECFNSKQITKKQDYWISGEVCLGLHNKPQAEVLQGH